jgi:hypothetical protein
MVLGWGILSRYVSSVLPTLPNAYFCALCTDTGGSQLIADGKIKLKSGPQIERFTEHAIVFDDGSELPADVVVFATG